MHRETRANNHNSLLDLGGSSDETGSSGGNETSLLSGDGLSRDGRGLSNVLVVSSSVGVVDGVHGHTSGPGPRVPLRLELVERSSGLEQG